MPEATLAATPDIAAPCAAPARRRFLSISAATFAAGGAMAALPPWAVGAAKAGPAGGTSAPRERGLRTVATTCDICFWKCGAIATVRDGKLWKIEGNPLDPLSKGRLCTRGTGGIGAHYDPDRLQRPLIRAGARGAEQWKVVSWGEALDFTASKLRTLAAQHGPETIALFKHGIGAHFVEHALKAFGTPNVAAPSFAQCRGPRDVGFKLTFGADPGTPENTDIENTQCLVLIGSHLGENLHNSQVQQFATALGRGAKLIVADPRLSTAASKADHWLPVKPGTDIALLRAWMHVLVREGLYDKTFVAEHGEGFDKFARDLAPSTPEWAAAECGVSAEQIRSTARLMAKTRPATLIHPGRRSTWYGDDAQRGRAVALLNALMGNWGRKGGFYQHEYLWLEEYPGMPTYPKSARGKADNGPMSGPKDKKTWPFANQTVTTGLREATITGQPYPLKAWVVDATNLLQAMPDRARTLQAIDALDLLVVIDTVPSEIAQLADVVLPESVYLERWDTINDDCMQGPFLALRQPVVEPPQEQKAGWWIGRELGRRLGVEAYFPWKSIEEYLQVRTEKGGHDWAQFRKNGVIVGKRPPMTVEEGLELSFDTPSGKVEFWSQQLADVGAALGKPGFEPVPQYTRPDEGPAGSLRMITGRAPMHTFSRTVGNPRLAELMPENKVWMNADDAGRLGLISGTRVRLRNQDGVLSDPVALMATERLRPGCVYLVHGFGSQSRAWRGAYRKGASTALLTTRVKVDPLMGGTSIHSNFVTVERA